MITLKELETKAVLAMDTKIKHLQEENTKLQQEVFSLQSRIRELESTIFGGSVQ